MNGSFKGKDTVEKIFEAAPYALKRVDKMSYLLPELSSLNQHHREKCQAFDWICREAFPVSSGKIGSLEEIPYLPVRIFKHLKLQSVSSDEVLKVLHSSGTTSQIVSQIVIDRETSILQTKALVSIVTSFIGGQRLPMIIVDSAASLKDPAKLSARAAGLVGLSNFGRNHFYALDEEMKPDLQGLRNFLQLHQGQKILIFGFTYMIWQYLLEALRRQGEVLQISDAVLIHSGGWKKLEDQKITHETFREACRELCGIRNIHNFYGMVEQVGGIYMECEQGYFHAPNMSEILVRDPQNGEILPSKERGLIQTLSILPRSYPGHSLLTEDVGVIDGIDDCPCGRMGTRFRVLGRLQQAELRGCSDAHAAQKETSPSREKEEVVQNLPDSSRYSSIAKAVPEEFFRQEPLSAFSVESVNFLNAISKEILKDSFLSRLPEMAALGFWLRKGSLEKIVDEFRKKLSEDELLMPRGVCFHVAPANVDTIFLYSWALSLLAGNINVVRISKKSGPEIQSLLQAISRVMSDSQWRPFTLRNKVLSYERSAQASSYLSGFSDIRMLWGGDASVSAIRSLPAKPNTKEVAFNDKFSYSIIFSKEYLNQTKTEKGDAAKNFWNDAYTFDQMACSSPRVVLFFGDAQDCGQASSEFWHFLENLPETKNKKYGPSVIMDKNVSFVLAIAEGGIRGKGGLFSGANPVVVRTKDSAKKMAGKQVGGGFFVEQQIQSEDELKDFFYADDQTLTYCGVKRSSIKHLAEKICLQGIDRVVPIGKGLSFSANWDGYVLLGELTRRVVVE